ncbi:Uncharacterised protein [Weeksella virosa]|uniref:DUF4268 domain-containing protein n=1 Tax=Weeksella virosa (strain ATCC 43766 / DSM 16922 / JCM 21250 / CCUG 30538 / CDC 9751 / IAM 14551 / NBRC 16016 / NCTC 11634 / CL345/78) TaxID=865938 RepID=F0NZV0_WEEVC|nr:hypothetical protein Weevi_1681 [Weeksella virosa DSM 16922]SUP54702.1 Uncharacterised protein [Weeksella virosa]VEH63974.1 Uncharacterised protein [Weeksella virosa]
MYQILITLFSKEEAKRIKHEFWTAFGSYMKLQPNAEGRRINWINYKTGIKGLFFKTDVFNRHAEISVQVAHPDPSYQQMIWEQLEEFELVFASYCGDDWVWEKNDFSDEGKPISSIRLKLDQVSIYRESDWAEIIRFLKENSIALDAFWVDHKASFDLFK